MSHITNLTKCGLVLRNSYILSKSSEVSSVLPSYTNLSVVLKSHIHIEHLSTNLQYITNEKVPILHKNQVLAKDASSRPLTLLYSWTLAKDRHVKKYAQFYTDRGVDVLRIKTLPYDLLFPKQGAQIVAGSVLDFLKLNSSFNRIFIHGLSVGAYAFGELMLKISQDQAREELLKRFIGQIWDSAVDIHGLPEALGKVFASNVVVQNSLEKYFKWYMKANREHLTAHLERAADHIYKNTVNVPGLWIYSEADLVSPPEMNINVYSKWIQRGEPTFSKCFKNSPHVSHYYKYNQEYEEMVTKFAEHVGLLQIQDKERMAAQI